MHRLCLVIFWGLFWEFVGVRVLDCCGEGFGSDMWGLCVKINIRCS